MPVFKYRDPQTGEWINVAGGGGAGESVDAYTKEETLSEETKATLGLGADAVPDDVFGLLSRFHGSLGNEYVWAKQEAQWSYTETEYTSASSRTQIFDSNATTTTIRVSDTLEDALNGVYEERTVTAKDSAQRNALNGKYVRTAYTGYGQPSAYEWLFYIDQSATWSMFSSAYGYAFNKGVMYGEIATVYRTASYVNSPDPNAYPIDDGYTYKALGQLGAKVQIATGSYTGTGTYGSSNKNMLTFDFAPKIWGLYQVDTDGSYYQQLAVMFPFKNITPTYGACVRPSGIEDTPGYWTIEVSGNTVSWWVGVNNIATYSALTQANGSNYTYYWFAIG